MVDNIDVTPGTGKTVATDDVGGIQYQVIKIATGADGAATYISNANPLPIGDAGGSITVDGTVAVTGSVTASGTVAATQSGTWNIAAITTLPALPAGTNNIGDVDVLTLPALPAGTNNIGDVDVLTLPVAFNTGAANATTQRVTIDTGQLGALGQTTMSASVPVTLASDQSTVPTTAVATGNVANGIADSGNPVKIGFRSTTSISSLTPSISSIRLDALSGVDGVQITRPHCNLEDIVCSGPATDTAGSSTTFVAAQAAGIKTYLTSIIISNSSAINVTVSIRDGTTGKITLPVPATGGVVFNPPVPIPGTAATAWTFLSSAAATTITVSGIGFKSKV